MNIRPLPKRWLIHTIIYEEKLKDKDSYGNPLFADPVTIKHVRVDNTTVFSRDTTDTKVLANGIVFVDTTHSTNVPNDFVEESKITWIDDKGNDIENYVLKKAADLYYPTKNKIHHWELEVI